MRALYIANKTYSSWSLRPWVLMRELGIPFEERLVPFASGPGGSNFEAFRHFSPTGKVPCLLDGDTVAWDSLGITEFLAESRPGVWPAALEARTWARCAVAEMHAGFEALRSHCTFNCTLRIRIDAIPPGLRRDLDRLEALWTEGLNRFGGPFLAGSDFTAVDAFYAPVAFRVQTYELPLSAAPAAYAARLLALPSLRAWQDAALQEPWRDPSHEDEARRAGTLIRDLRDPHSASPG